MDRFPAVKPSVVLVLLCKTGPYGGHEIGNQKRSNREGQGTSDFSRVKFLKTAAEGSSLILPSFKEIPYASCLAKSNSLTNVLKIGSSPLSFLDTNERQSAQRSLSMHITHYYIWFRAADNPKSRSRCYLQLLLRSYGNEIDFNRDIRPILSENCFLCHGPEGGRPKRGRRGFRRVEAGYIRRGNEADLDGYSALVPGEPDESELLFLVTTDYKDERMPPVEHGKALSEEQIALLRQWILEGGEYDRHWSYKRI